MTLTARAIAALRRLATGELAVGPADNEEFRDLRRLRDKGLATVDETRASWSITTAGVTALAGIEERRERRRAQWVGV